jgi:GNAT superfamily N-acetyltransferase
MSQGITIEFKSGPVDIKDNLRPGLVDVMRVKGILMLEEPDGRRQIGFIEALSIPTQALGDTLVHHMMHGFDFEDVTGMLMSITDYGFHRMLHELEMFSAHVMVVSAVGVDPEFQNRGYGRSIFEWMSRSFHDPIVVLEAEPMVSDGKSIGNHDINNSDAFMRISQHREKLYNFYKSIGLHQHAKLDHIFMGHVQRHKTREAFIREAWA